jgi:hypothetical protein
MDFYIGDPELEMTHWELQNLPDNCAVAAQTSILNQYLRHDISMDEATYVAVSNGWYAPGFGTAPEDLGNILEAYGIPTHSVANASIEQLAAELQQGHRVIVGVNSGQLWDQGPLAEFWNWVNAAFGRDTSTLSPADHAIAVTGLDLSDLNNPMVIVNDPGHPDGAGQAYPLDRFMDAWENSDFHYTATSIPPDGGAPPAFSIAEFLGWGTTAAGAAMGLDPISAVQAGNLVHHLVESADWDLLLATI